MGALTAGSPVVINPNGAERTRRGGAGHHLLQPVFCILAPALIKSAVHIGIEECVMDDAAALRESAVYQFEHSE